MTAQHTKHAKHTKRKRRRRSPLRILIILILVIAVLVGLTLSTVHKKLGKISTKSLDHSQLVTVNKDSNMTDYTNYAFFGIDSQTGSMSDRGNRSDSIIVVSINNSTKDVKLLSICMIIRTSWYPSSRLLKTSRPRLIFPYDFRTIL